MRFTSTCLDWHSNMVSVWTVLSLCLGQVWHKLTQMPQTHTKTSSHPPTNANMPWVTTQQSNTFIIPPAYMSPDFEFKQRLFVLSKQSHISFSVWKPQTAKLKFNKCNYSLLHIVFFPSNLPFESIWRAFFQQTVVSHRLGRDSNMF